VTLTIDGVPCPLGYVSPTQVNAVVPSQVQAATSPPKITSHSLVLQTARGQTNTAFAVAPAYGTLFGWGDNHYAAALDSNYQLITPANPAVPGQIIALFGTGLGATTPVNGIEYANIIPRMYISSPEPLAYTELELPASLDPCANFRVVFAGRAPGFNGLDQINVQVPTMHAGCNPANPEVHNIMFPISIAVYSPYSVPLSNEVMLPIK
jgi:uncharacterized protein (TIGR03437 family)